MTATRIAQVLALILALLPGHAWALKYHLYNLPEMAEGSQAIASGRLQGKENSLSLQVEKYIKGTGPTTLKVAYEADMMEDEPAEQESKVIVCFKEIEGTTGKLLGYGNQAIWPRLSRMSSPLFSKGAEVEEAFQMVLSSIDARSQDERVNSILVLLGSGKQAFRYVGYDLVLSMRDRKDWKGVDYLAASFALMDLNSPEPSLLSSAQRTAALGLKGASVTGLISSLEAIPRGQKISADRILRDLVGRSGMKYDAYQPDDLTSREGETIGKAYSWLRENTPRLIVESEAELLALLTSDKLWERIAGENYTRALLGSNYDYDANGVARSRERAIKTIELELGRRKGIVSPP